MPDRPAPTRIPAGPGAYLQGEATTLVELLADLGAQGYPGQLAEREGALHCFTCGRDGAPGDADVEVVRRLEGASDPADMLLVLALRCPHCGTAGTLTLNYGPESTPGESALLDRLELPEPS